MSKTVCVYRLVEGRDISTDDAKRCRVHHAFDYARDDAVSVRGDDPEASGEIGRDRPKN